MAHGRYFTGPYYNAPIISYKDGSPVYERDDKAGKYVVIDDQKGTIPVFDPRFTTIFPRMWSNEPSGSEQFFKNWIKKGVPINVTNSDGKTETLKKPTFLENMKYFLQYQVGVMYFRYFMWNFAGRQNDIQGYGGPQNGNWISGIPFIDKWLVGHPQTHMPDSMKNRGTNKYYMFPFVLGLVGFFYQMRKEYKGAIIITLLFLMTGLAIVVYLNQKPFEPRERDYSYCGSTFAFSIWIGLGIICLINLVKRILKRENLSILLVSMICLILVPGIMAKENWDDHDRSGKYSCRDYAANYLNSCDKQGILFTNGDNDTFPLWYDQEVEGIRTDVRVVNLMLAGGSWYMDGLFSKSYESEPCPFGIPQEKYKPGINDIIPFYDIGIKGYMNLKDLVNFIKSDDSDTYLTLQNGEKWKFFPSRKVKLAVDSAACIKYGIVPEYLRDKMVDTIYWTIKTNELYKNDLMLLDLVANNNWRRPLYFVSPSSMNYCFNADTFCLVTGWVYKFLPVKATREDYIPNMGGVDPLTSYDLLMNKFAWGNMNDPHVYVDPESLSNQSVPKTNMYRTAQSLINIRRYDDAIKLMDKYFELFPDSKYTYDMYTIPFAELYYRARNKHCLETEVIVGGVLKEYKGINIPDINLRFNGLTGKDKNDIEFSIKNKLDYIAQSFVRSKKDILIFRDSVKNRFPGCAIIAKIENKDGIRNIDEIIEVSDGIMIARGDMGVSLPIYEIAVIQKMIIRKCNRMKKMVITATQMLESMTEN